MGKPKNVQTVRHFCYTNCTNTLKNQEVLNLCAYSTALSQLKGEKHIEEHIIFNHFCDSTIKTKETKHAKKKQ